MPKALENKAKSNGRIIPKDEQKSIKIQCDGTMSVGLDEMVPLQGDLKVLTDDSYRKVVKSLEKYGFSFPFFVWAHDGKMYVEDGHQRQRVLMRMAEDGYNVPRKYPAVNIKAKNEKEAKEKILLLSSQYGKYTEESLHEFWMNAGLQIDEMKEVLDLQQINWDHYYMNFFGDPSIAEGEVPTMKDGDRPHFQQMTFTLHDSQVETVQKAVKAAKQQGGNKSEVNENTNGNALAFICERFNGSEGH